MAGFAPSTFGRIYGVHSRSCRRPGSGWVVKYKTVPYVAEVDSQGAALAIKPADPGGHPADERTVRYQPTPFGRGAGMNVAPTSRSGQVPPLTVMVTQGLVFAGP